MGALLEILGVLLDALHLGDAVVWLWRGLRAIVGWIAGIVLAIGNGVVGLFSLTARSGTSTDGGERGFFDGNGGPLSGVRSAALVHRPGAPPPGVRTAALKLPRHPGETRDAEAGRHEGSPFPPRE